MRFHHSTRRGRKRQSSQHATSGRLGGSSSKWSQVSYCRDCNIHFNRSLPVEPPRTSSKQAEEEEEEEDDDEEEDGEEEEKGKVVSSSMSQLLERLHLNPSESSVYTKFQSSQQLQDLQQKVPNNNNNNKTPAKLEEVDKLDMEIARERLLAQVKKHTFWSSKAARRMHLTGSECRPIYIYELVSWCERRELEWRFQPYRGGLSAPGPSGSLAPCPPAEWLGASSSQSVNPSPSAELVWSLEPLEGSPQAKPFTGYVLTRELPESSFVKRCHACQGRGRLKCSSCHGVGYEVCISCSGKGTTKIGPCSGYRSGLASGRLSSRSSTRADPADDDAGDSHADDPDSGGRGSGRRGDEPGGIGSGGGGGAWGLSESCHFCHGAGQKRCWVCAGRAYNCCTACQGASQLRCYLNLTITWLNHRDEVILNNSDEIIKRDRLRLCSGLTLVQQSARKLRPLSDPRAAPSASAYAHQHHHQPTSLKSTSTRTEQLTRRPAGGATFNANPHLTDTAGQVSQVSRKLLERHRESYGTRERILMQRQQLTQYKCHIVRYEWKDRRGHFVVYGNERKVYIAKYPFKSLCNIT